MATNETITYTVALDATQFNADIDLARKNVGTLGESLTMAGKLAVQTGDEFETIKKNVAASASAMSEFNKNSSSAMVSLTNIAQKTDVASFAMARHKTEVAKVEGETRKAAAATTAHGGVLEKLGGRDSAIAEKGMRTLGQAFGGTSSKASEFIGIIGDSAELLAGGAFTIGIGAVAFGLSKLYDAYQETEQAARDYNAVISNLGSASIQRHASDTDKMRAILDKRKEDLKNFGKTQTEIDARNSDEIAATTKAGFASLNATLASQNAEVAALSKEKNRLAKMDAKEWQDSIQGKGLLSQDATKLNEIRRQEAEIETQLKTRSDALKSTIKLIADQSKTMLAQSSTVSELATVTSALTEKEQEADMARAKHTVTIKAQRDEFEKLKSTLSESQAFGMDARASMDDGEQAVKKSMMQERRESANKRDKDTDRGSGRRDAAVELSDRRGDMLAKADERQKQESLARESAYQARKQELIMGGVGLAIGATQTIVQTLIDGDKYALETIAASIATNVGQFVVGEGTKAVAAGIAANAILPGSGAVAMAAGGGLIALGIGIGGVGYGLGADVANKKKQDAENKADKQKAKDKAEREREKGVNGGNTRRSAVGVSGSGGITLVQNFGVGGPTSDDNARYLSTAARLAARRGRPWAGVI